MSWKDYEDDAINALRDNLKTQTIKAFFDYTDYEQGCDFIVDEEVLLTYDKGQVTKNVQKSNEYDYTVQNLIDKEIYDPYEIFSERYLKDHYDNFVNQWQTEDPGFAQFLKDHKEDIYPHLTNDEQVY